ncbi:flagellar export protein FliJ [Crassaminicella profunda]|uniref:flagellar export protein FliJ n=1 Tax=Crassaminicella profunda TaxID=1286698 RepID=UPI001CA6553C|nr:flagellar export protein FliJ [Crassaminicella profunda]QZY56750.1 flagellar export protein FliJ [Crassaminicella profunda]
MLKFSFKYQNLLKVKEKYEDVIKGKMHKAQSKLQDEKKRLEELENQKNDCGKRIALKIQSGASVGDLKIYDSFVMGLKRKISEQMQIVEQCSHEVNKCRQDLMKAAMEKRTFEKLKEKEKENFYYMEKKEEENFVDQLVTFQNFKSN